MCFFEIKFLKITGYIPLLENCCKCNRQLKDLYSFHKDKIYFSVRYGGILCKKCADSSADREDLSASDYRFLYDLFNLKLEDFRDVEVNPLLLKECIN